jgi:aconitate hydratase
MVAIGVGGLEVALAISGRPLRIKMPQAWGLRADGREDDWTVRHDRPGRYPSHRRCPRRPN